MAFNRRMKKTKEEKEKEKEVKEGVKEDGKSVQKKCPAEKFSVHEAENDDDVEADSCNERR